MYRNLLGKFAVELGGTLVIGLGLPGYGAELWDNYWFRDLLERLSNFLVTLPFKAELDPKLFNFRDSVLLE